MGAQDWTSPLAVAPAYDAGAYANSAALTDVSPVPQVVIRAGTLQTGDRIKIRGRGKFSNTGTPTLKLGLYLGGVAGVDLASTGAITTITAAVNWPFEIEAEIICRGVGTVGAFATTGKVWMPGTLTQAQLPYWLDDVAFATVAGDTTVDKTITLGAQWGAASASNTLTVVQWSVEGAGV